MSKTAYESTKIESGQSENVSSIISELTIYEEPELKEFCENIVKKDPVRRKKLNIVERANRLLEDSLLAHMDKGVKKEDYFWNAPATEDPTNFMKFNFPIVYLNVTKKNELKFTRESITKIEMKEKEKSFFLNKNDVDSVESRFMLPRKVWSSQNESVDKTTGIECTNIFIF